MTITAIFKPDYERYEGVRPINIWLLRLLFLLVVLFVASDSWSAIVNHNAPWDPVRAAAVCMWAAYSVLSIFGLTNPLRWPPIVLFEIPLQAHLAHRRGLPALVNKSTDRLAGRRDDVCLCLGYLADRSDAVVLRNQDLRSAVKESQIIGVRKWLVVNIAVTNMTRVSP